jgi:hypothetical protein
MANLQFNGTVLDGFPFFHLYASNSDNDSMDSAIISNIQDTIANNITLPFSNAFHVVHINAEDLLCHFGDIYNLFFSSDIHAILISETCLKPFPSDTTVNIPGYNILRHDRIGKGGGGVCAYIRDDLKFNSIAVSNLDLLRTEYLFLK